MTNTDNENISGDKREYGAAWLYFQRRAMTLMEKGQFSIAEEQLKLAFKMTSRLCSSDPRSVITLNALADLAENQSNFEAAIYWTLQSANRKMLLVGPSALVLREIERLVRLRVSLGQWEEARRMACWSMQMSQSIPDVTITEGSSAISKRGQSENKLLGGTQLPSESVMFMHAI